mmetsp:Transcript_7557/g.11011  ORF Transcript_7557/g.11011 Transcript_7557/m.11011 type:complete len:303 (-) Transcript_7557:471-1379(-)
MVKEAPSKMKFATTLIATLLLFSCAFIVIGSSSSSSSSSDSLSLSNEDDNDTLCPSLPKPSWKDKEKTARWMVHTLDYGVLSTISTRTDIFNDDDDDDTLPSSSSPPVIPFGNVYSFVDGPCNKSTGIPYLYGSSMDQSMKDVTSNNVVSLTLTEASSRDGSKNSCVVQQGGWGDPEMPTCARVVITGKLVRVDPNNNEEEEEMEFEMAQTSLFQRHPSMSYWPDDHDWFVSKIVISDMWLLDMFGGASILDVDRYFSIDLGLVDVDVDDVVVKEEQEKSRMMMMKRHLAEQTKMTVNLHGF